MCIKYSCFCFFKKFHYVHAFNVFNDVLGVGLLQ